MQAKLIFSLWLPGQMPSGKNDTEIDYRKGKRVAKRTKSGKPNPWTRWYKRLRIFTRPPPPHPWDAPLRIHIDYWWGDLHTRDEDGRSSALGCFLEAVDYIADDKHIRTYWRPCGLDRKNPGLLIRAYAEPEILEPGKHAGPFDRGSPFPAVQRWRCPELMRRKR